MNNLSFELYCEHRDVEQLFVEAQGVVGKLVELINKIEEKHSGVLPEELVEQAGRTWTQWAGNKIGGVGRWLTRKAGEFGQGLQQGFGGNQQEPWTPQQRWGQQQWHQGEQDPNMKFLRDFVTSGSKAVHQIKQAMQAGHIDQDFRNSLDSIEGELTKIKNKLGYNIYQGA